MTTESRQTFLYKLDANCRDFLPACVDSQASDCMRDHFSYLKKLHEKGDILLFGLTLNPDPSAIGLCVFYAESEAQARSIMDNDPLVAQGLAQGTLYPFRVTLHAPKLR